MHYKDYGFDDYDEFLSSPQWKQIKAYFFQNRTLYKCNICGTHQDLVLHKRSYKFLSLPDLKKKYRGDTSKIMRFLHTFMTYLCRRCHRQVHFLPNGERVPLEYRKLKDRETALLKQIQKKGLRKPVIPPKSPARFLGTYFTNLIRK